MRQALSIVQATEAGPPRPQLSLYRPELHGIHDWSDLKLKRQQEIPDCSAEPLLHVIACQACQNAAGHDVLEPRDLVRFEPMPSLWRDNVPEPGQAHRQQNNCKDPERENRDVLKMIPKALAPMVLVPSNLRLNIFWRKVSREKRRLLFGGSNIIFVGSFALCKGWDFLEGLASHGAASRSLPSRA